MKKLLCCAQHLLDKTRVVDFLPLLLLRLYLAPVFWMAGTNKLFNMDNTIAWFGNPDWGLGLPFPTLMAWLATSAELAGAILLLLGLLTRWVSIPLMITMLVAMFAVHWDHGWFAIAQDSHPATVHLNQFLAWLKVENPEHHSNLLEHGRLVVLQNGIEFASTYFVMLLVLFFYGAGKFVSMDYWLAKWMRK